MSETGYGVLYAPSDFISKEVTVEQVKQLQREGVDYIRLQWVDLTSVVRFRVVSMDFFVKLLSLPRPGVGVSKVTFGVVYEFITKGFSSIGEYLFVPDLTTLTRLPFEDGVASVMGWFQEKEPDPGCSSLEVDLCPRTILKRVVREAKEKAGLEFLVGFETEFVLLKSTDSLEPASEHFWTASNAFRAGSVPSAILREIADCLKRAGIGLILYHAECAPGQYEVVTEPMPPLQAADALVLTREIIVNVAAKHGLRATFAPHIHRGRAGNGAHAHISIHPPSRSEGSPASELSTCEASFIASILEHLPALMALTIPIPASYKRIGDGLWSGGTYACWGTENREAPIRLTNASSPSSRNFEMRFLDGTCNPYLALASIIGVGTHGIQNSAHLTLKDCTGTLTAIELTEEGRRDLGITERIALSWEEARKKLGADKLLREMFGSNFVDKYLAVNKHLAELLGEAEDENERLKRLVEFY